MILQFTLTMPNIGSWNGTWTGEGNLYARCISLPKDKANKILQGKTENNFYYNWGDGWGANVNVKEINSGVKKLILKRTKGFCGYDWMIDEIIKYQKIKNQ